MNNLDKQYTDLLQDILDNACPSLLFKNDLTVPKTTVRPTIDS